MKQIFKLSSWMFAMLMTTSITTSCVESEQNPFDSGVEDGSGNVIDAKLPYPGSIGFSVGDEVIVKGSGFTKSDEIYIHNLDYEYNEDANGNGNFNPINVEAEIKSCTPNKLIFILPEEFNTEYNSIVYMKRNNKEYKLGEIRINPYRAEGNGKEIIIYKERFSGNEKAYYQNIKISNNYDSKYEYIGEKQELNIIDRNEYEIRIFNKYALGEFMVFLENNGELAQCGTVRTNINEMIRVNDDYFQPNREYTIEGAGFLDDDRIILKNNGQEINVEILRTENNDNKYFPEKLIIKIPSNINRSTYNLILKRNGVEHIIRENITIY